MRACRVLVGIQAEGRGLSPCIHAHTMSYRDPLLLFSEAGVGCAPGAGGRERDCLQLQALSLSAERQACSTKWHSWLFFQIIQRGVQAMPCCCHPLSSDRPKVLSSKKCVTSLCGGKGMERQALSLPKASLEWLQRHAKSQPHIAH